MKCLPIQDNQIFSRNTDGQIQTNNAGMVWMWNSSMTSSIGNIDYTDGKIPKFDSNANIISCSPILNNLPKGYYVWVIWAWDKQGINIKYASREMPFQVM